MRSICIDDVEWEELDWGDLGWVVRPANVPDGEKVVRTGCEDPARPGARFPPPPESRGGAPCFGAGPSSSGSAKNARNCALAMSCSFPWTPCTPRSWRQTRSSQLDCRAGLRPQSRHRRVRSR